VYRSSYLVHRLDLNVHVIFILYYVFACVACPFLYCFYLKCKMDSAYRYRGVAYSQFDKKKTIFHILPLFTRLTLL